MTRLGMSLVLLIGITATLARPQPRNVKLITEPRPGQEYVSIQSSVFRQEVKPVTQQENFATSHKIPGALPVDEEDDDEEVPDQQVVVSNITSTNVPSKIKRESDPDDEETVEEEVQGVLQGALLTPDEVLPVTPTRTVVRTEVSVAMTKSKKEGKKPEKKVNRQEDAVVVEVDSKGDFGKLEASLTGEDERKVMLKKQQQQQQQHQTSGGVAEPEAEQEQQVKEVEVNPASQVGVKSPKVDVDAGVITVRSAPIQQVTTTPAESSSAKSFDILPVNLVAKTSDVAHDKKGKDFDFVDTPLADKVLVPAGSSNQQQQSRIEVKKGPNGQDYEYEYVYYYYDDDENDTTSETGGKKPSSSVVKSSTTTHAPTTQRATTTSRHYLPEVADKEVEPVRTRGRNRATTAAPQAAEEEIVETKTARNKYASIERTAATGAPEASNEILPARGTQSRFRGRTITTEEPTTAAAAEERLPANTRFPPRSRSNHNSNSIPATTPVPAPSDSPITRVRGGGSGAVRRPSLELVDSSSFKTHSSDASRDQDLRPEFPSSLPEGPVRFVGVAANEEDDDEPQVVVDEVKTRGSRVRGGQATSTTTPASVLVDIEVDDDDEDISSAPRRGQPSRQPIEDAETDALETPTPTTTRVEDLGLTAAAMDKAVNELYSLFQQAQAENTIDEDSTALTEDSELEELATTEEATTIPPTTTTTTPAPTTTTTTTTTTTQEPSTTAAAGRGRYRQRTNAAGSTGQSRNRFRSGGNNEATSTTSEAPVEASTKSRARFGSNRVSGSNGNFGRKGYQKSTTQHPEEHSDSEPEVSHKESSRVEAAPATRSGAGGSFSSRNRFSAARRVTTSTTTASPSDDSGSSPSSPPASAKPAFAERFNSLRRRGGLRSSTTVAPLAEETKSESSGEETNEPTAVSEAPSTTVKANGRQRLSIGSRPRPLQTGASRVNIGSRGRLGVTTTTSSTTPAAPSTEVEEGSAEQTSSSSQDEQSQSDEAQEVVTTPVPDALTRLRNRPRLRVNAAVKQQAPSTASPVRRPLGLLPRRRPHPAAQEAKDSSESESQESSNASSNSETEVSQSSSDESSEPSTDATSTTVAQEPAGKDPGHRVGRARVNQAFRRPRTLFPSAARSNNQE